MVKMAPKNYNNNESNLVTISIDLEEDILLALALYAHELDITLNQAVNKILKEQLELYHNDPEKFKTLIQEI